jgi:hypothetical protein
MITISRRRGTIDLTLSDLGRRPDRLLRQLAKLTVKVPYPCQNIEAGGLCNGVRREYLRSLVLAAHIGN